MKNSWNVMKKDFDKVFKFPRMLFSTLILPGLIIFLIYAFMGNAFGTQAGEHKTEINHVYIFNAPESFKKFMKHDNIEFHEQTEKTVEELKNQLYNEEIDALVIFSEDFDQLIEESKQPELEVYYNPNNMKSSSTFDNLNNIVLVYKTSLIEDLLNEQGKTSNLFKINEDNKIGDPKKASGLLLAMLLPMLIVTFIFASSLGIGTDAIAGEKERGTLSTLLMAPIKKNEIIYGKILSTTIISVLAACSSFIGILASMPFSKEMFGLGEGMTIGYSILDYLGILAVFFVLAIVSSSLILICSTFGKTIKEATSYAMPIYIVAMISSMVSMFNNELPEGIVQYLIPVYNATLGIKGILTYSLEPLQLILILGSSAIFIGILIFILLKLFKSEKVIFNK